MIDGRNKLVSVAGDLFKEEELLSESIEQQKKNKEITFHIFLDQGSNILQDFQLPNRQIEGNWYQNEPVECN